MQIEIGWLLASITGIVGTLATLVGKLLLEYKKVRDDHDAFLIGTIEWQRGEIDVLAGTAGEAVKSGHEAADIALKTQRRRP